MRALSLVGRSFALAAVALWVGNASAQSQIEGPYRLHSILDAPGSDFFGTSVGTAGDIDRDGFDDVLVGAPGADINGLIDAGSVFLFSGKGGFLIHRFDGLSAQEEFGYSVAGNSDVDNDGVPDILVGAPGARIGGVPNTGKAYVISGATYDFIRDYPGRKPGARFGTRSTLPGDLDGDGYGDIAVSAPLAQIGGLSQAGKVFVINGRTSRVLFSIRGLVAGEQVGSSLAAAGDTNRDGIPDLVVGSPEVTNGNLRRSGRVGVVSGASGQIHRITGFEPEGELGASVAGGFDFDGDGSADIVVGAPGCSPAGHPRAGCILVYSGYSGVLLSRIDGAADGDELGRSIDFASDVDNDGVPEILVGASATTVAGMPRAGVASLFSGRTGSVLFRYEGRAAEQRAGFAVARSGDVDGDGHDDIVIGAPSTDALPGTASAEIYMYDNVQLAIEGTPRLGGSFSFLLSGEPGDSYIVLVSPRGGPGSRFTPLPFPIGPGNASSIDVGLENWRFSVDNPPLAGVFPASGFMQVPMNLPVRNRFANVVLNAQFVTFPGAAASLDKVSNAVSFVVLPPN